MKGISPKRKIQEKISLFALKDMSNKSKINHLLGEIHVIIALRKGKVGIGIHVNEEHDALFFDKSRVTINPRAR